MKSIPVLAWREYVGMEIVFPAALEVGLMRSSHVMVTAMLLLAVGCTDAGAPAQERPSQVAATTGAPCAFRVVQGEPPPWARAGFQPGAKIHYASSGQGDMLAVLFGYPLYSPPMPDRGNKILWRSKLPLVPSDPLRIEARLNGVGIPARITVDGGPGPSLIDLPSPGCWRLNLKWSSHADSIDLEYVGR